MNEKTKNIIIAFAWAISITSLCALGVFSPDRVPAVYRIIGLAEFVRSTNTIKSDFSATCAVKNLPRASVTLAPRADQAGPKPRAIRARPSQRAANCSPL